MMMTTTTTTTMMMMMNKCDNFDKPLSTTVCRLSCVQRVKIRLIKVSVTVTAVLFVTPDCDMLASCCAFDFLSVRSVIKFFIVVTRADHRLREVNGFIHVGHRVLRQ